MPILAGPLEKCLDDLIIDTAPQDPGERRAPRPVLRYFDHVLPLRDGVADLPLGMLLAEQHYRLAYWHDAATELNWRRFFDIDTLIGDPGRGSRRVRRHPPGAAAAGRRGPDRRPAGGPSGRAGRPARATCAGWPAATGGAWVVVEKILARGEELPATGPARAPPATTRSAWSTGCSSTRPATRR